MSTFTPQPYPLWVTWTAEVWGEKGHGFHTFSRLVLGWSEEENGVNPVVQGSGGGLNTLTTGSMSSPRFTTENPDLAPLSFRPLRTR